MQARFYRWSLLLTIFTVGVNLSPANAQTRTITPALDGTGTVVNQQGNQFEINGGSVSGDGQNLFHSFEQFNLSEGQVANFLSNPNIRNILGRVVGGDASFINGLIQVTGGNSNLFLMNPAGIVFGANASLNVPAAFTVTTANGIGFGAGNWFNTYSNSDWSTLVGTPSSFRFDAQNPGAIINNGQLAVNTGQPLTLIAGTVINTGTLVAPEGTISVQTVPGENLVRISQDGHLLNLEVAALPNNTIAEASLTPLSLPQLLTGGETTTATEVIVNAQGEVVLTSGQTVESGDIAIGYASDATASIAPESSQTINNNPNNPNAITGQTANLNAANTLTIAERSLQTTGDLNLIANNTVRIRDSLTQPFSAEAGGNVTIIGRQNIDILALDSINILRTAPFQAGGNITLASDGIVSGDSHFSAGGNFSILNSTGAGGVFLSLYDPIIYSDGDVVFGSYEGASLKVEATGAIIGGDINITTPDITLEGSTDPDAEILSSSPSLILRSGVATLSNDVNIEPNTSVEGTGFINRPASGNNDLSVGDVTTAGGPVILNATGRIVVDEINTQGGNINLQAVDNIVVARNLNSVGGDIEIATNNFLQVGTRIDPRDNIPSISSANPQADGSITILHGGGETPFIIGDATVNGTAKSITSSSNQITPVFEVPPDENGIFTQGNITIQTTPLSPTPPPVEPPTPFPTPTPEPPGNGNPGEPTPEPPDDGNPVEPTPEPPDDGNPVEPTPEPPDDGNPVEPTPVPIPEPTPTPGGDGELIDPTPNPDPPIDGDPIIRDDDPPINPTPGPVLTPTPPFFPVVPTPSPSPTPLPPTPIPPTPPPTPPSDDEVLSPSQAEEVTTVLEAELVDRKNRSSSLEEEISTENRFVNNSILSVEEVSTPEGQTLTIQQNTDGSIALRESEPTSASIPSDITSDTTSEINVDSGFDAGQTIELARVEVTSSLDSNNLEESVSNLEEAYSLDYLNYLGKDIADFETDTSAQEIQEKLSAINQKYSTKAAIIYVFSQEDELILMAVTAQGEVIKKSVESISREQLLRIANQFRFEITDARKRYSHNYKAFAQELYGWIVKPLEDEFKAQNIDTLLFVMDRGLRNLPLAALHDGEQFLIEKYNFSLIPSFSLMHIRDRPLNDPRVLAMGASRFTEKPPLPAVPIEVSSITKKVTGNYFLNEEFTIKNFKRQRATQSYNVIHLATHSEFNAGDADNSYIQFWDDRLTVNNLKNFGWKWETPPAELFVLSACRTAIGDEKAELGFAGLAIQAGVPSALASLWYVSDQGTLGLMVEFYNQLRESSTIAEAFRAAQLAMLSGEISIKEGYLANADNPNQIQLPNELMNQGNISFSHPYYWAGFTLIGSPW